jgi:hypothetical protein
MRLKSAASKVGFPLNIQALHVLGEYLKMLFKVSANPSVWNFHIAPDDIFTLCVANLCPPRAMGHVLK